MIWHFRKLSITGLTVNFPREEVLRRSRILIVDDEKPELIEDLKKARFSVDYQQDITAANMDIIERPLYDLVLLDFGNVGSSFGSDEGLSLLRHMKRLNPSLIVLAYTSRSLGTDRADFYRLADGVLAKDAGIAESMEKIEEGLRKAHSIENVWKGLLTVSGIKEGSAQDKEMQDLLIRGLNSKRKMKSFKDTFLKVLGSESSQKVGFVLIEKILELSVKSFMGLK